MTTSGIRHPDLLRRLLAPVAIAAVVLLAAGPARAQKLGDVFVIDMENHNFVQPSTDTNAPQQLLGNLAAPFLNGLMTPGNPLAAQVSYASAYHNVLATPSGNNPSIHPSEPNYMWQEAGSNFGVLNDNDPYVVNPSTGLTNVQSAPNLSGLLQAAGIKWKSYQEDIDLATNANGQVTSNVLPQSQWTVPLSSVSGTSAAYVNPYNGSNQYNYATKHDGQPFFTATNGGTTTTPNTSPSNPEAQYYSPLQALQSDLNNNTVGRYNLITPNQYNDMHSALSGGFTYNGVHYTGDSASIAQGDNFLSIIVPQIMASQAYKNNGAIVIWFDETEGTNANDFSHTIPEIVISSLAKGNAYTNTVNYTHSSDLKTLQELFGVYGPGGTFLGDAASPGTNDLSDLFVAGAITAVPEPSPLVLGAPLALGLLVAAWRRRRAA
jgi:hypothetical protein